MDTALFNGKLISAYDISLDYNIEKQVRLYGQNNIKNILLMCAG